MKGKIVKFVDLEFRQIMWSSFFVGYMF